METGHIQSENAPVAGGGVYAGGLGGSVLTRAPSLVFDRLRSFNLSRFVSGDYQAETEEVVEPATDVLPDSASQGIAFNLCFFMIVSLFSYSVLFTLILSLDMHLYSESLSLQF